MAERKTDSERFRFTVPAKDADALAWITEQSNLSMSLRMLIRQSIARDGIVDITCKPITPGVSPGRPKGQVKQVVHGLPTTAPPQPTPVVEPKPLIQNRESVPVPTPQQLSWPTPVQADADGFVDPEAFF